MEEKKLKPNYAGILVVILIIAAIVVGYKVYTEIKDELEWGDYYFEQYINYEKCSRILASFVTHIGNSYDEIDLYTVRYAEKEYTRDGSYVNGVKWDTKSGMTYIMLEDESFWIENPETGEIQRLL